MQIIIDRFTQLAEKIQKQTEIDSYRVFHGRGRAFPGLELYSNRDASEDEEEKPMVASYKGYTAFDGDREQAKDKIEQLKSQFASQIEALNVDEILKNRSENQEE